MLALGRLEAVASSVDLTLPHSHENKATLCGLTVATPMLVIYRGRVHSRIYVIVCGEGVCVRQRD